MPKRRYRTVALGGTFDHFHEGHKAFIRFAHSLSAFLVIGVSGEKLCKGKAYQTSIEPFRKRVKAVEQFCTTEGISHKLVKLEDTFGPTIDPNEKIDAICVTQETLEGAVEINTIRKKLYLPELIVHVAPLKQVGEKVISSKAIRAGKINSQGFEYLSLLQTKVTLNQKQKNKLKKEQGKLVKNPTHSVYLRIVVGDFSLKSFIEQGWNYNLGIYDHKVERTDHIFQVLEPLIPDQKIDNNAGTINPELSEAIEQHLHINDCRHIFINGEEDLTAVSAILVAPLGTQIFYGQPGKGMVEVLVTPAKKEFLKNLLQS